MKSIKVNVELGLPDKKKLQSQFNQVMGDGVLLGLDSSSFKKQLNELRKQTDKLMIDIAFDKQQVDIINKYIKDIGLRSGKDLSKAIKEGWASGDIESILKNSFDDLLAQTNKDMSKNLTETVFKQYDGFAKELRGKKFSLAGVDLDKDELAQLKKDIRGTLSIDPNAIGIDSLMEEIKDIGNAWGFAFDSDVIQDNVIHLGNVIAEYKNIKANGLSDGLDSQGEEELYIQTQKHYIDLIADLQNLEQAKKSVFDEDGEIKEYNNTLEQQNTLIGNIVETLKESSKYNVGEDGSNTEILSKVRLLKDEYGNIVREVETFNSKTNESIGKTREVTNEIKKQKQAQEDLNTAKKLAQKKLDGLKDIVSEEEFANLQKQLDSINVDNAKNEFKLLNATIKDMINLDKQNIKQEELSKKVEVTKEKYRTTLEVIKKLNKELLQTSKGSGLNQTLKGIADEVEKLDASSLNELSLKTKTLDNSIKEVKADMTVMNKEWTLSTRNATSFGSAISSVVKAVGVFDVVHEGVTATMRAFKDGYNDVVAMDTALADLNKVVDLNKSQLLSMRDASVEMGKALGRSSIDVAQGMAEFGRQYKNIEDIKRMTEASIIGANVMDGMSSGDVAKGLTTILNSMKIEATEVMTVIDSMNEIQNRYRISATDMTNALAKVGSVANTSGVDLQELEGYITAITVATGKAGDEVGTAVRAIMARTYKDYSVTALEKVGVAVRDAKGEFREFPDIMTDLDRTWQNLTNTQKIELAQTVAGVQRYNEFMSLMNNFGMATSATATAMDSLGSATKENEIYLNSIEGKMQTLKTTAQEFWYNLVNSDFIKGVVDGGTSVLKVLNGLSETFGSLPTAIGLMSTAFLTFTNNPLKNFSKAIIEGNFNTTKFKIALDNAKVSMSTTSGVTNKAIAGVKSLTSSFGVAKLEAIATSVAISALNTILSVGLSFGLTTIISGLGKVVDAMIKTKAETRELNEEFVSFAQSNNGADGTRLVNQYKNLQGQLATLKEGTNEYKLVEDELIKTQERLAELYPEVNSLIDENTGKKLINLEATEKLAGKELDKAIAKANTNLEDNDVEKLSDVEALVRKYEDYARIVSELNDLKDKGGKSKKITGLGEDVSMSGELKIATKDLDVYLKRMEDAEGILKAVAEATDVLGVKNEEWASANELICESLGIVNDEIDNIDSGTIDNARDAMEDLGDETTNTKTELENLIDAFSSFEQPIELLEKAIEEYKEYGILSTDTFHNIIKSGNADLIALLADNETFLSNAEGMLGQLSQQQQEYEQSIINTALTQNSASSSIVGDLQSEEQAIINTENTKIKASGQSSNARMDNEKKVTDNAGKNYSTDSVNFRNLVNSKIKAGDSVANALIDASRAMVDGQNSNYSVDANNFANFINSKLKNLEYYNQQLNKSFVSETKRGDLFKQATKELQDLANKSVMDGGTLPTGLGSVGSGYVGSGGVGGSVSHGNVVGHGSTGSGSGGSKGSSEKVVKDLEVQTNRYRRLQYAIDNVNAELEKNSQLAETITDDNKMIDNHKKEIDLLNKKIKAYQNLRAEQLKEQSEMKNKLSGNGFSFDGNGDLSNADARLKQLQSWANSSSGDEKERRIEQVKDLEEMVKAYEDLRKSIVDSNEEILDLQNEVIDVQNEIHDIIKENIEEEYDKWKEAEERKTDKLKSELQKRVDLMNKEWDNEDYADKLDEEQRKLNELQSQRQDALRTGNEELVKSLEKEINNQQKTINDMIRDKERDNATSKADDMIEAIEKDLEARIEAMDKEMQEETLLGNVKSGMTTLEEIMNNIGLASNSVNMNMLMVGDSINTWNTSLDTFISKMNTIQGRSIDMSINGGVIGGSVGNSPNITITTTLNMEGVDLANEENLRRLLDENAEEIYKTINDQLKN